MAVNIGGFQPVTASDFPGRMAAIVFTQGCNFRCPFCHNAELLSVKSPPAAAVDTVIDFLSRRKERLTGLVITGGEPCIQSDLPRFCRNIKAMGYAVKLDTNGSRPGMIETLLTGGLVDFIAMDIKAPVEKMHLLAGVPVKGTDVLRSITLISKSGISHLFRTTDVAPLLSSRDHIAIREMVPPGSTHIVQPFISKNALSPALRTGKQGD